MQRFVPKNRLTVRTKSGNRLGHVVSVEVDELAGKITTFFVAANGVLKGLLGQELAVAWNQVVEWQNDELVVSDATVPAGSASVAFAAPTNPAVNMSERT